MANIASVEIQMEADKPIEPHIQSALTFYEQLSTLCRAILAKEIPAATIVYLFHSDDQKNLFRVTVTPAPDLSIEQLFPESDFVSGFMGGNDANS